MNIPTEKVEHLLRKAPSPTAPAGLLEDLRADIILPRATSRSDNQFRQPSFLRRWIPVLSLSLWLMTCLVLLGVQIKRVADLKAENARLLAEVQQRTQSNASESMSSSSDLLSRLRGENEELYRLRAEVSQLQQALAVLNTLRAENDQLAKNLQDRGLPGKQQDFIAAVAEKGERTKCINNLKQVGLGARMFANDHGEVMPTDFSNLQQELPNQSVTFCPSGDGSVPYEILSPGEKEGDPNIVFARCPVHNHALLMDGSAHQLGTQRKVAPREDGKMIIRKVQ